MYTYACFFATLRLIVGSYNAYFRKDVNSVVYLALWSIWALALYAAFCLRFRFKDKTMFMIVSLYIAAQLIMIFRIEELAGQGKNSEEIMVWLRPKLNLFSSITILLLTPSIEYLLFCYGLCYIITISFCVLRFKLEGRLILNMFGWLIGILIFWFILQKRELKRFYEQQDAKSKEIKATEKEVELTNVLNLHQDVVIVYS